MTDTALMFRGFQSRFTPRPYRVNDFNQIIESWDVSKVTDMSGMFYQATQFNQPIALWETSKVTAMSSMFRGSKGSLSL